MDCKVDTGKIGEHYMLIDATWNQIHDSNKGMLCIGCLESRLNRPVTKSDFNDSHVNKLYPGKFFSARLQNILFGSRTVVHPARDYGIGRYARAYESGCAN